jgi:sugar lactone lactonase YvrE
MRLVSIVVTVAGAGPRGDSGDGGPAVEAKLNEPSGLAVGPDGSIFIADCANERVRRVDTHGVIAPVAGTGKPGSSGDGGLATAAKLRRPERVALGPDGSLFISDTGNHKVRRVNPEGVITTFAGNGAGGFQGDGGPADEAELMFPKGIAVAADGSVFVATSSLGPIPRGALPGGLDCVRKIDAKGIITTVAGAPSPPGEFADGIPAIAAVLSIPEGIGLDMNGALLIADSNHNRVRRVVVGGLIGTVAGVSDNPGFTGTIIFKGDDGPAIKAGVAGPSDVAVADDGTIYIADTFHNRIRRVTAVDGIITTVAGTGKEGSTGDGGLATDAKVGFPKAVAVGPDGSVYFTDQPVIDDQHRVRRLVPQVR